MNERGPKQPAKGKESLTAEHRENPYVDYYENEYVPPEIHQDSPEVIAEKISQFETLITVYGQTYDLAALSTINGFSSSRKEREASFREEAKNALVPINKIVNYLRTQKSLPAEDFAVLKARFSVLTKAVGRVKGDEARPGFDIVLHD